MQRIVTTVELNMFERMVPLIGGYLQAAATADPFLSRDYRFHKRAFVASTANTDTILSTLVNDTSDVYAFSCYVWNTRLILSLLPRLITARPHANIILGGPQVTSRGERY